MEIRCKASELDEVLEKLYDSDEYFIADCYLIIDEEDGKIEVENLKIDIPALGLSAREGIFIQLYEDGEWMPDFSLTVLYDGLDKKPNEYIYWEQDGLFTTIHNFFYCVGEDGKHILNEDDECIVTIESI